MKLKPCPFCGEQPNFQSYGKECMAIIACRNLKCKIKPKIESFEEDAIWAWNTRAEEPTGRTAHWDINIDGYYPFCSHCGEAAERMSPHCPNCGYRMTTRRHGE